MVSAPLNTPYNAMAGSVIRATPVATVPVAPRVPPIPGYIPVQDRLLDRRYSVSSGDALGFFTAGFLLAFGGRGMVQVFRKQGKQAIREPFDSGAVNPKKVDGQEFNLYQNYNEALSSIYRLIQFDPSQGKALMLYAGISVLGYLSGNVVQGAKESWVRQQETKIRAQLINRLQDVVRQSIRSKTDFNIQFKEVVRNRLSQMLMTSGVADVPALLSDVPVVEPVRMQQRFFYEPTHRTIPFGANPNTFPPPPQWQPVEAASVPSSVGWQKAFIMGLGAFSGFVLSGFMNLLLEGQTESSGKGGNSDKIKINEGLMLKDRESWAMMGMRSNRNFWVMAGFFAMSAAASLGKQFLDGLREIEVTRLNARTELDYQTHNWLTQDPMFHNIAEQETVESELRRFQMDLPCLKLNRVALQQRTQAILANIGRNSAPPYYLMTPQVSLVEARA